MVIESTSLKTAIDLLESLRKNSLIASNIRLSYTVHGGTKRYVTLKSTPMLFSRRDHLAPRGYRRVHGKGFLPRPDSGSLAVFGGAIFEEVGMLHGVQHIVQPGQRVAFDLEDFVQTKLDQATVGDESDVLLHLMGR